MSAYIHTVPVETLRHIFVFLLSAGAEYNFPLVLRLVCRRWQTVAENTPQIWTVLIVHGGMYWTQRALKLSINTPLDVTLHANSPDEECVALDSLMLSQIFRIRTLALRPGKVYSHILPFLRGPAPLLEDMELDGEWRTITLEVKSNLMHSPPPRLAYLRLVLVKTSPDLIFFKSPLTHLCLNHCQAWETIDEFLTILSSLPRLERLSTTATFPSESTLRFRSTPANLPQKVVELSQMKCIEMLEDIEPLGDFMPRITLPQNCSVEIVAQIFDDDLGPLDERYKENILAAVEHICRGHLNTMDHGESPEFSPYDGFEKLEIYEPEDVRPFCAELVVRWSTFRTSRFPGGSYQLKLSVPIPLVSILRTALAHMIKDWAPASHRLVYLDIHDDHLFEGAGLWNELLPYLWGVIELSVTGCSIECLMKIMSMNMEPFLLTYLRRIRLSEVDLSDDTFFICMSEMEKRQSVSRFVHYIHLVECAIGGRRFGRLDMCMKESSYGIETFELEGPTDESIC